MAELADALARHACFAADRARSRLGGPLSADNLSEALRDDVCFRYPVEIGFDETGLEPQQFADARFSGPDGQRVCKLHVRPRFKDGADVLHLLVAYMAAPINYGDVATPDLCEQYGAALVGMTRENYYKVLCASVLEK